MKHKGKSAAIYASKDRAFLVHPGQEVPRSAKFVISHSNFEALAWALDKSTNGHLDGRREPCLGGLRSYSENAEAVLQRVVDDRIEPVTLDEFQILRHALGSSHLSATQPDLGWRNHYSFEITDISKDGASIAALVERGLLDIHHATMCYFVTPKGMALAGAIAPEPN